MPMQKTPSSAAWLASRYSRAKGMVARQEFEVARQERRLTHHARQMELARGDLAVAKVKLADEERRVLSLAKTIDLHEASIEMEEVPAIGPKGPRFTLKFGGLTRSIIGAVKPGEMRIDDLIETLAQEFGVGPKDRTRFKVRLNTRLARLQVQGCVRRIDPPHSPGRRWTLVPDYRPKKVMMPPGRQYITSEGSLLPAHWLIRTQQELMQVEEDCRQRGEPVPEHVASALSAVLDVWGEHPMNFEVHPKTVSNRLRRDVIRSQILQRLKYAESFLFDTDFLDEPDPVRYGQAPVSLKSIQKALKQLLLEGLVQRHLPQANAQAEWSLTAYDGESINTSDR